MKKGKIIWVDDVNKFNFKPKRKMKKKVNKLDKILELIEEMNAKLSKGQTNTTIYEIHQSAGYKCPSCGVFIPNNWQHYCYS